MHEIMKIFGGGGGGACRGDLLDPQLKIGRRGLCVYRAPGSSATCPSLLNQRAIKHDEFRIGEWRQVGHDFLTP